jgi:Na+/proline symporter
MGAAIAGHLLPGGVAAAGMRCIIMSIMVCIMSMRISIMG